ncbi:hypothetical protein N5D61_16620 [Pseudomonas sp. GD03842]|uniref:hypothetical protein n=1 Tax=unclassified Pseudomonas TaxID=196821 RepID=UPI000D373C79|nr:MULTISPECIES: hypothetical protein [unclassified Pseudomonas]MDH0747956.1 hypothetical protein [Pseudomonas sp. GD03842]RAU44881.1 hypothetical protein DBP26_015460 [Pseudomonas sp. RIT 409]RAU53547.1 hypothetical protein DBY65_015160 [Pseudomonas sp. RIT 412]
MKRTLLCLLAVTLLAGCSTMGGEDKFSATYVKNHIIPHKTTQSEVQAIYGVPDSQFTTSSGHVNWRYNKNGNLSDAANLVGYIPGASAVSSALSMTNHANNASNAANTASGKISGDTEHHSDSLSVWFDKNKVVDDWSM